MNLDWLGALAALLMWVATSGPFTLEPPVTQPMWPDAAHCSDTVVEEEPQWEADK